MLNKGPNKVTVSIEMDEGIVDYVFENPPSLEIDQETYKEPPLLSPDGMVYGPAIFSYDCTFTLTNVTNIKRYDRPRIDPTNLKYQTEEPSN